MSMTKFIFGKKVVSVNDNLLRDYDRVFGPIEPAEDAVKRLVCPQEKEYLSHTNEELSNEVSRCMAMEIMAMGIDDIDPRSWEE